MRVLYLTEESISFGDALVRGGAIHVRNVVEGLRDRGHEVHLVDWNDAPERPYQHSVRPRTRFVDGPARTFRRAVGVARSVDADVIVSKTRKTYLPGFAAARVAGVPHVVHVGSLPVATEGTLGDRLDTASLRARLAAPHDGYLAVCDAVAEALRDLGAPRDAVHGVGNAVDTEAFAPDREPSSPASLDDAMERAGDRFVVGYVGGLHRYKGVRDLPPAIDRCEEPVYLVLAGDGPERAALEAEFGDDATLLGSLPYDHVPAVYHAADAIVLPSYTEGLPRVVLEAQATGTPVVATDVGGVPEVVADRETGLLVEPGDVAGLAGAIDDLAGDADLRERIAEAGRESVVANWSWEQLYGRYEQHLDEVVEYQ